MRGLAMALQRTRLGELIELVTETNSDARYGADDVRGMTITKEIIPTKADVKETDLSKFIVVQPNEFVFNPRTHGKRIGFGFNSSDETFLISWNNIAFRIRKDAETQIDPVYLFMHFNREEWDREACYQSWGSSTEVFTWDALCDMELMLPSISIQRKYARAYVAARDNLASINQGIDELRLTCDSYVEKLLKEMTPTRIANHITLCDERNGATFDSDSVRGISVTKKFIPTKANMNGVNLSNYKLVKPRQIAYVTVTSRNSDKITVALNDSDETYIVSATYVVFETDANVLLPEYLMLFLSRSEFDRYARFNSWGSARETFNWEDMQDVRIPIPSIEAQKAISDVYVAYFDRKRICDELAELLKDVCPILIKGSIDEARR